MIQKDPGLFWALLAIWIALGIFILYPVVRLVGMAFMPDGHFSIATLIEAFQDTYTVKALCNSLWLALAVSVTGTILGYLFALLVTRTAMPKAMKALLSAVTLLPLIAGFRSERIPAQAFPYPGFPDIWVSRNLAE